MASSESSDPVEIQWQKQSREEYELGAIPTNPQAIPFANPQNCPQRFPQGTGKTIIPSHKVLRNHARQCPSARVSGSLGGAISQEDAVRNAVLTL
ncbi:MAG: hypothetical protein LBJ67_10850 [Planctomycetaceae bacterium]|nr:hypothetical protein [Planctomycetaceae bacterium]